MVFFLQRLNAQTEALRLTTCGVALIKTTQMAYCLFYFWKKLAMVGMALVMMGMLAAKMHMSFCSKCKQVCKNFFGELKGEYLSIYLILIFRHHEGRSRHLSFIFT